MAVTLPLAEIKAHLSETVDRVEREHERVILTRSGRPAAVIMSPAHPEALEDAPSCCPIRKRPKEIRAGRDDTARDRVITADELRASTCRGDGHSSGWCSRRR